MRTSTPPISICEAAKKYTRSVSLNPLSSRFSISLSTRASALPFRLDFIICPIDCFTWSFRSHFCAISIRSNENTAAASFGNALVYALSSPQADNRKAIPKARLPIHFHVFFIMILFKSYTSAYSACVRFIRCTATSAAVSVRRRDLPRLTA